MYQPKTLQELASKKISDYLSISDLKSLHTYPTEIQDIIIKKVLFRDMPDIYRWNKIQLFLEWNQDVQTEEKYAHLKKVLIQHNHAILFNALMARAAALGTKRLRRSWTA